VATQNGPVTFTVEVYNLEGVRELLGPALPYLESGDTVDLGRALANGTPDISTLNSWASQLAARLPSGILLTARVESLGSVRIASQELSPLFRGLTIDYEPDPAFFPNWTWNFSTALSYYQNATAICHQFGRLAIAYPSGRPLRESDLQKYNWDYAAIARTADLMKVETQDYGNLSKWPLAIGKLETQFSNDSVSLGRLTTQISVGSGGNAVNASVTVSDIRFALNQSVRSIYVWWALADEPGFLQVLQNFSGTTPPPWPVTITESGLPPDTEWWVNLTGGESVSSTRSNLTFSEPNGTYSYTLGVSDPTFRPSPAGGNFTVSGASLSEAASFVETTYPIAWEESGLPTGTLWWVSLTGGPTFNSTNRSISFAEPNGTYDYALTSANASWTPFPDAGRFSVQGRPDDLSVTFTPVAPGTYRVSFAELGLPVGTTWSVRVENGTFFSSSDQISVWEPNGTYPFEVAAIPGFTPSPSHGSVVVAGTASDVEVRFASASPETYRVNVTEVGLPAGAPWWANASNGESVGGSGPFLLLRLPNGTFEVSFSSADTRWEAGRASVGVDGGPGNLTALFAPLTYGITFEEEGLPGGTSWTVTVAGTAFVSNRSTLSLPEMNGTYPYALSAVPGFVLEGDSSGQIVVLGGPSTVNVTFTPASGSPTVLSPAVDGTANLAYVAFAAVGIALLVALVARMLRGGGMSRQKRPPRTPSA